MASYRCQQCWRSFDTKLKVTDHSAGSSCRPRSLPEGERLMTSAQEDEIEACYGPIMSEEDFWWRLFQRLIPGMQTNELDLLKQLYSPCE